MCVKKPVCLNRRRALWVDGENCEWLSPEQYLEKLITNPLIKVECKHGHLVTLSENNYFEHVNNMDNIIKSRANWHTNFQNKFNKELREKFFLNFKLILSYSLHLKIK